MQEYTDQVLTEIKMSISMTN